MGDEASGMKTDEKKDGMVGMKPGREWEAEEGG